MRKPYTPPYIPSEDQIRTLRSAYGMMGLPFNDITIDALLRMNHELEKDGDMVSLRTACAIIAGVHERWAPKPKPEEHEPGVWTGRGFLGYKTKR